MNDETLRGWEEFEHSGFSGGGIRAFRRRFKMRDAVAELLSETKSLEGGLLIKSEVEAKLQGILDGFGGREHD